MTSLFFFHMKAEDVFYTANPAIERKEQIGVSHLKALFSEFFKQKLHTKSSGETNAREHIALPEFSTKYDIFEYLNFKIPDLQPIKLSLDLGNDEKAFEQFYHYLKIRNTPLFLCNWWKREEIVETLKLHYTESVLSLLEAANQILQQQFLLFSSYPIQADSPIDWNTSYEAGTEGNGILWPPGKAYTRSELLEDSRGDIHFVWALNRHQHFLDLGQAYWYTLDETYVEEFMREINGWIAQNPYPHSVNWVDPYEIALRGIFWLFGYTLFFPSELINEHFFCFFYRMLLVHGHVTYHALSTRTEQSPPRRTHHLVAQAVFLYLLGTLCPEYLHSKTWSTVGWEMLQWKSPLLTEESILDESFVSIAATLELYCLALLIRRNNRYHVPQAMTDGLTRILERFSLFVKPDGTLSRFGEEIPQQLLPGMYRRTQNYGYLFTLAALLLKHPAPVRFSHTLESSLLWFFGNQGMQEYDQLASTAAHEPTSCLLPDTPYAVMQSTVEEQTGYCLISTGVGAAKPSLALKHTDLLSFELFANGYEYLIDSGPYSFSPIDPWNRYFQSGEAHNSVMIDGISHLTFQDREITSLCDQWVSTPTFDFFSGYHTGFDDLQAPVVHRRSFFYYKPTYWIVSDLLTGGGQSHLFEQFFHFPPFRLHVDFTKKRVDIQTEDSQHFLLMPLTPSEMDVSIFTGGESPDSGWISRGYKQPVKSSFIKYGKHGIAPASFHTLLYAYTAQDVLQLSGRCVQALSADDEPLLANEVSALEISSGIETHYFILAYQPHQRLKIDDFLFSGTLCFLRIWQGQVVEIMLYKATLLMLDETVLFEADLPVETLALQVDGTSLYVNCSESYLFRTDLPQITEVFVNKRKSFVKRNAQGKLVISTSKV
ncbi:hypothetical protein GF339_16165 [candidate division KSB3 bacterium]|uniref:Heparin-sulfate lyase N-terminal domain-containing protein n=1 Tax=candidate division KSB3 bacterium TaxID=2044937 RepID=A0A9D5JYG0_9BACT|nr:hypothetical protein [candidate division KSB3 bacterium]MBD3326122.1 hypothetical protein [candidate division KSB3 bacterium]